MYFLRLPRLLNDKKIWFEVLCASFVIHIYMNKCCFMCDLSRGRSIFLWNVMANVLGG